MRARSLNRIMVMIGTFVAVVCVYSLALRVVTEPWRVWGNDYRAIYWTVPALVVAGAAAILAARKSPRFWSLLILLVPLFVLSTRQIIDGRLRDSIVSCGNHKGFWNDYFFDPKIPLPASTGFEDYLLRINGNDATNRIGGYRCPGYKLAGTRTGVVFVGGGLRLSTTRGEPVLIAFCSWRSHPPPHDHQHYVVWEPLSDDTNGRLSSGCANIEPMMTKLEAALKQAKDGATPYSPDAVALMEEELHRRRELFRERRIDRSVKESETF